MDRATEVSDRQKEGREEGEKRGKDERERGCFSVADRHPTLLGFWVCEGSVFLVREFLVRTAERRLAESLFCVHA